jgi:hypothetical protein
MNISKYPRIQRKSKTGHFVWVVLSLSLSLSSLLCTGSEYDDAPAHLTDPPPFSPVVASILLCDSFSVGVVFFYFFSEASTTNNETTAKQTNMSASSDSDWTSSEEVSSDFYSSEEEYEDVRGQLIDRLETYDPNIFSIDFE